MQWKVLTLLLEECSKSLGMSTLDRVAHRLGWGLKELLEKPRDGRPAEKAIPK